MKLSAVAALAAAFDLIRIGDVYGVCWASSTRGLGTAGLLRSGGGAIAADTNGNGILEQTEFLPNTAGTSAVNTSDTWNNQNNGEGTNTSPIQGNGFTNIGATGSNFTDRTLLRIEPTFVFDFFVATGDINPATSQPFFNLVFGDYDVSPANIDLIFASSTTQNVALTLQPGGQDGLVQAATTTIAFSDIFTTSAGGYNGFLHVDFNSPNEPYTAFDFVELSLEEISFVPVPEPGPVARPGLAIGGFAFIRRQKRNH